jgi:Ca2+-binding EF-hand superfamily protein
MKAIGLVFSVTVLAFAMPMQDGGRQGPPGGGRGGSPGMAIFNALDTDHDQTLSASEIDAAPLVLKQLDRNGDGMLTVDELFAGRGRGDGGGEGRGRGGSGVADEAPAAPPTPDDLAATLMAFDKNHDGKLTKDEVPARFQGLFERADTNHDGVLTADEIKAAAAAQPQPAAGQGGGEGRRGEGGREGGPPRDPLFSALDLNGDGTISADEIAAAPASLRKLDTNGDGVLSFAEIFGAGRGRG